MLEEEDEDVFSEDVAGAVCERLQSVALPQLSAHEQIQLVDIVECAGVVEKQRRSMDENGARFTLFLRQHALLKHKAGRGGGGGGGGGGTRARTQAQAQARTRTRTQTQADAYAMSWREISWAFHSSSQDILADFVAKQYHGSMVWENARESGVFMWLSDPSAVVRSPFPIPYFRPLFPSLISVPYFHPLFLSLLSPPPPRAQGKMKKIKKIQD